ncbi:hypothetical protein RCL1_007223 [Eukaryota sp. TZLM3-RCL]
MSNLPHQWRKFAFFQRKDIKADSGGLSYLQTNDVVCVATLRGHILFGDSKGSIHICDRSFQFTSFSAHQGAVCCIATPQIPNFISAGCDEDGREWKVCIWSLRQRDPNGSPSLLRTLSVASHNDSSEPISQLCVNDDMTMLVVALASGTLILFSGDLLKDRSVKGKVLTTGDSPVTGLSFLPMGLNSGMGNSGWGLFCSTRNSVVLYKITNTITKVDLEHPNSKIGCPPNCSTILSESQEFAIGTESIVWYYGLDGKHGAHSFEGPKRIVSCFRQYLVIITPPERGYCTLGLFDLKNQCIVFHDAKIPDARLAFSEWGFLFILTHNKQLIQLEERDLHTKLDLLYKKSSFEAAISLAKQSVNDTGVVADVYRRFGDHLYRKGDHSAAMTKYLCTIGGLEPSYVIRRYLNGQLISHLATYLKALHDRGFASSDHTSLLLNCYTKLKNTEGNQERLRKFIESDSVSFDVLTAIQVFISSELYDYALFLAKKHSYHVMTVKILIDYFDNVEGVLDYITQDMKDDDELIGDLLLRYGRTLVSKSPDRTTKILIEYCQGKLTTSNQKHALEQFLAVFVNHQSNLIDFLESLLGACPESTNVAVNTLLELYLANQSESPEWSTKIVNLLKNFNGKFEVERAFVLLRRSQFKPGLLFLYSELNMLTEIARLLIEEGDDDALLTLCQEHGSRDANLWMLALEHFSAQPNSTEYLSKALSALSSFPNIPPLVILKIAAKSHKTPLNVVKPFIIEQLKTDQNSITEDQNEINRIKNQMNLMQEQVDSLKNKAKIFQSSKCCSCNQSLSLPATHFLCSHSFHTACLGDNENQCSICYSEQERKLKMVLTGRLTSEEIQQYYKQLDVRGFSAVPNFIARGVLSRRSNQQEESTPVAHNDDVAFDQIDADYLGVNVPVSTLDWDFQ